MKPLNIKSTRPSRAQLEAAIDATGRVYAFSAEEWRVYACRLAAELLALQHGMEELERKWREAGSRRSTNDYDNCADELQKLREGDHG